MPIPILPEASWVIDEETIVEAPENFGIEFELPPEVVTFVCAGDIPGGYHKKNSCSTAVFSVHPHPRLHSEKNLYILIKLHLWIAPSPTEGEMVSLGIPRWRQRRDWFPAREQLSNVPGV